MVEKESGSWQQLHEEVKSLEERQSGSYQQFYPPPAAHGTVEENKKFLRSLSIEQVCMTRACLFSALHFSVDSAGSGRPGYVRIH